MDTFFYNVNVNDKVIQFTLIKKKCDLIQKIWSHLRIKPEGWTTQALTEISGKGETIGQDAIIIAHSSFFLSYSIFFSSPLAFTHLILTLSFFESSNDMQ